MQKGVSRRLKGALLRLKRAPFGNGKGADGCPKAVTQTHNSLSINVLHVICHIRYVSFKICATDIPLARQTIFKC